MILITADWHLNDNSRDSYRHDFVGNDLVHIIKKEQLEYLFILGDLTDEKNHHDAYLVHRVTEHIYKLSQLCKIVILKGNHDYIQPDYPFFAFLGRMQNVDWITYPHEFNSEMLFLPHTSRYDRDWVLDGSDGLRRYKYVFTHNTFAGARAEHGQELGGIPVSVFSDKQTVFSGDVHVPQTVGCVEYVGSPLQIDFGDDPDRHVVLFDEDSGEVKYIKYKGPFKIVLEFSIEDQTPISSNVREGDIVKVLIHIKPGDFGKFQDAKSHITKTLAKLGCHVYMVQPVVERGGPVALDRGQVRKKDDLQVLKDYSEAMSVREPVVKTGIRLMRQA